MIFCIISHNMLTLEVAILLNSLIYPSIHDFGWLPCLALLWNPPPKVNMGTMIKTWVFVPLLDSRATSLRLVFGLRSRIIQYNSVNEEDMWKGIVHWGKLKGILLNMGFCPSNKSAGVSTPTSQTSIKGIFGILWVNQTQGFMHQKKYEDLHNKLIPTLGVEGYKE